MTANLRQQASLGALAAMLVALASTAHAAPTILNPDYSLSVFATGTGAYSQPDSIAVDNGFVYVGYGNGVSPTDFSGASTVVQYTATGALVQTFSVPGHNDGLKIDPATHLLWAMQNEDANPQLRIINPNTGVQTAYTFGATPHGGGIDDIAFTGGRAFVSASSPTLDSHGINTGPVILSAVPSAGTVAVTPVLAGQVSATDIRTGSLVTVNNTDPDSMTVDPMGRLVLDDQSDSFLTFVANPGTASQTVSVLPLSLHDGTAANVDDTLFTGPQPGLVLLSDRNSNTVYAVHGPTDGLVFSASPGGNFLATLDPLTGELTPIIDGLSSPHGLAFEVVDEPTSLSILGAGLVACALLAGRRRRPAGRSPESAPCAA